MLLLALGLLLFLGMHSASIVAPNARDRLVTSRGEGAWKNIYSLVSAIGLGLIVYGYGQARNEPVLVYLPQPWLRHVTLVAMVPVFPLFVATYFPGRIQRTVKHPTLLATVIWAIAHLLMNGMQADLLLFGGFLFWALADRISVSRRPVRPVPGAPPRPYNDAIVVGVGLALYGAYLWKVHLWMIGVPPMVWWPLSRSDSCRRSCRKLQ